MLSSSSNHAGNGNLYLIPIDYHNGVARNPILLLKTSNHVWSRTEHSNTISQYWTDSTRDQLIGCSERTNLHYGSFAYKTSLSSRFWGKMWISSSLKSVIICFTPTVTSWHPQVHCSVPCRVLCLMFQPLIVCYWNASRCRKVSDFPEHVRPPTQEWCNLNVAFGRWSWANDAHPRQSSGSSSSRRLLGSFIKTANSTSWFAAFYFISIANDGKKCKICSQPSENLYLASYQDVYLPKNQWQLQS